jgi:hypothetical protein
MVGCVKGTSMILQSGCFRNGKGKTLLNKMTHVKQFFVQQTVLLGVNFLVVFSP